MIMMPQYGGSGRQQQQVNLPKHAPKKSLSQNEQLQQHLKGKQTLLGSNSQRIHLRRTITFFNVFMKMQSQLYEKYSSSQNYYYTREVNEIIYKQEGTVSLIRFKDQECYDDNEEQFFQEYYEFKVYPGKIAYLTEYYKFHNDIARLFMEPLNHIVNYYHDKQRKIKYKKITKMLAAQQEKISKQEEKVVEEEIDDDYQNKQRNQSQQLNEDLQDSSKDEQIGKEIYPKNVIKPNGQKYIQNNNNNNCNDQEPSMERLLAPLESFLRSSSRLPGGDLKKTQLKNNNNNIDQTENNSLLNESMRALNDLKMRLADIVGRTNSSKQNKFNEFSSNNSSCTLLSSFQSGFQRDQQQHSIGNLSRFLQFQEQQDIAQQLSERYNNNKQMQLNLETQDKITTQGMLTRQMISNVMMTKPIKKQLPQQLQLQLPLQPQIQHGNQQEQLFQHQQSQKEYNKQSQQQFQQQQQQLHSTAGTHGSISMLSGIPSHHPSINSIYSIPTTKHLQENQEQMLQQQQQFKDQVKEQQKQVIISTQKQSQHVQGINPSNGKIKTSSKHVSPRQETITVSSGDRNGYCLSARGSNYNNAECEAINSVKGSLGKQSEILYTKKVIGNSSSTSRSNSVHKQHSNNQQLQQQQQQEGICQTGQQMSQLCSQYPSSFQAYKQHQQRQQQQQQQQQQQSKQLSLKSSQSQQQQQQQHSSISQLQSARLATKTATITMPASMTIATTINTCPSSPLDKKDMFLKLFENVQLPQAQDQFKNSQKKHAESVHVNNGIVYQNQDNEMNKNGKDINNNQIHQPNTRLHTQTAYHSRQASSQMSKINQPGITGITEITPVLEQQQQQQQLQFQQIQSQLSSPSLNDIQLTQQQQILLGNAQSFNQLIRSSNPNLFKSLSAQQQQQDQQSQCNTERRDGYVSQRGVSEDTDEFRRMYAQCVKPNSNGDENYSQRESTKTHKRYHTSYNVNSNNHCMNSMNQQSIQEVIQIETQQQQQQQQLIKQLQHHLEKDQQQQQQHQNKHNQQQQFINLNNLPQSHQLQQYTCQQHQSSSQVPNSTIVTQSNQKLSQLKVQSPIIINNNNNFTLQSNNNNNALQNKGCQTARTGEEQRILANKLHLNLQILNSNNNNINEFIQSSLSTYNHTEDGRKESTKQNTNNKGAIAGNLSKNISPNISKTTTSKTQQSSYGSKSLTGRIDIPKLQLNADMLQQVNQNNQISTNSILLSKQRCSNPNIQTEAFEQRNQLIGNAYSQQISNTEQDQHNRQSLMVLNGQNNWLQTTHSNSQYSSNNNNTNNIETRKQQSSNMNNYNSTSSNLSKNIINNNNTNGFMTDRTHYSEKVARKQMNVSKHAQQVQQSSKDPQRNQSQHNKNKVISHTKTKSEVTFNGQLIQNASKMQLQQQQLLGYDVQAQQFPSYNSSRHNSIHQLPPYSGRSNIQQQLSQPLQSLPTQPNSRDHQEITFLNGFASDSPLKFLHQGSQLHLSQQQPGSSSKQFESALKMNPISTVTPSHSAHNQHGSNNNQGKSSASNHKPSNSCSNLKTNKLSNTGAPSSSSSSASSTSNSTYYTNNNNINNNSAYPTFPYNYNSSLISSYASQKQQPQQQQHIQGGNHSIQLQQSYQPKQQQQQQQQSSQPQARTSSSYYQSNQAATVRVSLKQKSPPQTEDFTRATLLTQPSQDTMRAVFLSQPSSDTMRLTLTQPSQDHILSPLLSHLQQSNNFKLF